MESLMVWVCPLPPNVLLNQEKEVSQPCPSRSFLRTYSQSNKGWPSRTVNSHQWPPHPWDEIILGGADGEAFLGMQVELERFPKQI